MEIINQTEPKEYKLSFHGSGGEYFGIVIVNWLLTAVTLGLYYPWAKANQLKYLYGATALNDDRFAFHGTGREMFKGFIKAIIIFIIIYGIFFLLITWRMPIAALLFMYAAIIAILPVAIHGSYRYRMSRTSWRGIRFGYRGDRKELIVNFFKWVFFTIITLGIYGSWFSMNLRRYLLGNVKLGNLQFKYKGEGGEFFVLNLKGYFLSIVTLGIYMFWWQRDLFAYYIDNISAHKDEKEIRFKSTATGGDFFGLLVVNLLILVFTLGLGYAWVVTRTMNFVTNKIALDGDIDLNTLNQTEDIFTDATGEDIGDILDIDLTM
jgi:uncharacterized membrane protein YjgN (DUF898 family)